MKKNSSVVFFLVGLSQFVTMAFLIIGSITAPIFKQIGYSKYDEITYGTIRLLVKRAPAQSKL
nr:ADM_HP1_G0046420.mRNA.1.CDS.1 [Saccharomyces cerevisiae]